MQHRLVVRRVVVAPAVGLVGDADLDRLERVEHVELRERDVRERVEARRLARHRHVEPAAAPAAPGVGPELVAALDEQVADVVGELGRERPSAHPGDVGLRDPDDPADVARSDARAGARAAGDGVGRRHERVRPVVEVEERRLGALQEHVAARGELVVEEPDGVGDHGRDPRRVLVEVRVGDLGGGHREPVVDAREHAVLLLEHDVELLAEDLLVEQVLDAQPDARGLVGVGGADAALGRPERVAPQEALGHPVELLVVRHDQVARAVGRASPRRRTRGRSRPSRWAGSARPVAATCPRAPLEMMTPETDEAIQTGPGLAALATRIADGSFGSGTYRGNIAVTSLAGLAFMSSGSSPGRGPYGAPIDKALAYVMDNTSPSGFIAVVAARRRTGRCIRTASARCSWPKPTA